MNLNCMLKGPSKYYFFRQLTWNADLFSECLHSCYKPKCTPIALCRLDPKAHEPSAYTQMHASSGGLDQEHSVEPFRTAGAVIILSNLLKGGIVHQSVVGQVPLKTEPLIASSGVKSEQGNPVQPPGGAHHIKRASIPEQ